MCIYIYIYIYEVLDLVLLLDVVPVGHPRAPRMCNIHICIHMHPYIHTYHMCVYTHIYIHTYISIQGEGASQSQGTREYSMFIHCSKLTSLLMPCPTPPGLYKYKG